MNICVRVLSIPKPSSEDIEPGTRQENVKEKKSRNSHSRFMPQLTQKQCTKMCSSDDTHTATFKPENSNKIFGTSEREKERGKKHFLRVRAMFCWNRRSIVYNPPVSLIHNAMQWKELNVQNKNIKWSTQNTFSQSIQIGFCILCIVVFFFPSNSLLLLLLHFVFTRFFLSSLLLSRFCRRAFRRNKKAHTKQNKK